ncbi:hypothetical protein FACS1894111_05390 [Clostridia bacterium]|nr:hypothetical protein FACS1894111_05390 [Clostridia bacterium]
MIQVIAVACIFVIASGVGYTLRQNSLVNAAVSENASFDTASFAAIEEDVLTFVNSGNLGEAKNRVKDLETAWDKDAARLKAIDKTKWTEIDTSIDLVLKQLRAKNQNAETCKSALEASLVLLQ